MTHFPSYLNLTWVFLVIFFSACNPQGAEINAAEISVSGQDFSGIATGFQAPEKQGAASGCETLLPADLLPELCGFEAQYCRSGQCFSAGDGGDLEYIQCRLTELPAGPSARVMISAVRNFVDPSDPESLKKKIEHYREIEEKAFLRERDFEVLDSLGLYAFTYMDYWPESGQKKNRFLHVMDEKFNWKLEYFMPKGETKMECSSLGSILTIFFTVKNKI